MSVLTWNIKKKERIFTFMHMYFEKIFQILVYQTGLLKTGCNDRYVLLIVFYGDQS